MIQIWRAYVFYIFLHVMSPLQCAEPWGVVVVGYFCGLQENECSECNPGFKLLNGTCQPYSCNLEATDCAGIQESELWKPGNPFTYGCIVHYLPLYNYCIMLHQRVDNGEHDVHLFGHRIPDTPILCPHFNGQKIGDRHDGSNNYDKLMLKSRMLENSNVHSFP